MKYYQKNAELFYKVDEVNKSFVELFRNPFQKRIQVVTNESTYTETVNRIINNSFTEIDETSFNNAYTVIKSEIWCVKEVNNLYTYILQNVNFVEV